MTFSKLNYYFQNILTFYKYLYHIWSNDNILKHFNFSLSDPTFIPEFCCRVWKEIIVSLIRSGRFIHPLYGTIFGSLYFIVSKHTSDILSGSSVRWLCALPVAPALSLFNQKQFPLLLPNIVHIRIPLRSVRDMNVPDVFGTFYCGLHDTARWDGAVKCRKTCTLPTFRMTTLCAISLLSWTKYHDIHI